ncbi:MAG: MetS family NSS transporter small subunit [Clostridium sp.]
MSTVSLLLFMVGATVLWGGLLLTLGITLYNERKETNQ